VTAILAPVPTTSTAAPSAPETTSTPPVRRDAILRLRPLAKSSALPAWCPACGFPAVAWNVSRGLIVHTAKALPNCYVRQVR
jgi:hypothetical protein